MNKSNLKYIKKPENVQGDKEKLLLEIAHQLSTSNQLEALKLRGGLDLTQTRIAVDEIMEEKKL